MPIDPKTYAEQWLARLDAEKNTSQTRKEREELLIEELDIRREAAQEWIDSH